MMELLAHIKILNSAEGTFTFPLASVQFSDLAFFFVLPGIISSPRIIYFLNLWVQN